MQTFIRTLIRYIFLNCLFCGMMPYRICIISASPKISSPQNFLYFFMTNKYFLCGYTLYSRYKLCNGQYWNTLNKKMHMVFFHPYLYKVYLVTLTYTNTYFRQSFRDRLGEHLATIFRRKHQMVQQQCFVMVFINMFTHTITLAHFFLLATQRVGELTPA